MDREKARAELQVFLSQTINKNKHENITMLLREGKAMQFLLDREADLTKQVEEMRELIKVLQKGFDEGEILKSAFDQAGEVLPKKTDLKYYHKQEVRDMYQYKYCEGKNDTIDKCTPIVAKLLKEKEELENVAKSASQISENQMYELDKVKKELQGRLEYESLRDKVILRLQKENEELKKENENLTSNYAQFICGNCGTHHKIKYILENIIIK